jgi:hypothetical protein
MLTPHGGGWLGIHEAEHQAFGFPGKTVMP